jgi:hypothetical protein
VPKKDVFALLKISEAQLEELLKAAKIPLDLGDYNPHIDRIKAIQAAKGNGSYVDAAAKHPPNQSTAIAPTGSKPMPKLVPRKTQPVDLEGIPIDGGVATYWGHVAKAGATADADALAGAPFDGIVEGSEFVGEREEALRQHGFNLYMTNFDEAMKDPELIKRVEEKYLGKLPERWNLRKPT